jgi:ribosomal protein L22
MESFKLLIKYGAKYEDRNILRFVRYCSEYARAEMIEYALEALSLKVPKKVWEDSLRWISSVGRIDDNSRNKISSYLESKIKEAEEKGED